MEKLTFKPFSKAVLIDALREKFPHLKVQHHFGVVQLRTSGFTVTGNVGLILHPKKGRITVNSSADKIFLYMFIAFPIGVYALFKRKKARAMEKEVVAGLSEMLEPLD